MKKSHLVVSIAMSLDSFCQDKPRISDILQEIDEPQFEPESIPYIALRFSHYEYKKDYPIKSEKLKVNEKPKAGGSKFIPLKGRR